MTLTELLSDRLFSKVTILLSPSGTVTLEQAYHNFGMCGTCYHSTAILYGKHNICFGREFSLF